MSYVRYRQKPKLSIKILSIYKKAFTADQYNECILSIQCIYKHLLKFSRCTTQMCWKIGNLSHCTYSASDFSYFYLFLKTMSLWDLYCFKKDECRRTQLFLYEDIEVFFSLSKFYLQNRKGIFCMNSLVFFLDRFSE